MKSQNAKISINIEIEANSEDGFDDNVIELNVKETLNQIKAKIQKIELK